ALRDALREERRNRVPHLGLHGRPLPDQREIIWKREQPAEFRDSETAVVPMEGAHVGPRLSLDGGRGPRWVEFQQEGPVPGAPLEDGVRVASLRREVQIVLAWRDLGEQMSPLPSDDLLRLG